MANGETARRPGAQANSTLFLEGINEIDRIEMVGWAPTKMDVSITVDGEFLGTTEGENQHNTYTIK
jgi:hypothetical protein